MRFVFCLLPWCNSLPQLYLKHPRWCNKQPQWNMERPQWCNNLPQLYFEHLRWCNKHPLWNMERLLWKISLHGQWHIGHQFWSMCHWPWRETNISKVCPPTDLFHFVACLGMAYCKAKCSVTHRTANKDLLFFVFMLLKTKFDWFYLVLPLFWCYKFQWR